MPKETLDGERRVALTPEIVKKLAALNSGEKVAIKVASGAGLRAGYSDSEYTQAGAEVVSDDSSVWAADLVIKVAPPKIEEVSKLSPDGVLIGLLNPLGDPELTKQLAAQKITAIALEKVPRITRAQGMDVLSSQSSVAGYKAVLLAAEELDRFFPMLTTAAGTVPPAKVLVLGAGVAGLQAIATAKRLGAIVTGFDVRSVTKEQVESLGAKFLEFPELADAEGEGGYARELTAEERELQLKLLGEATAGMDVVITTALVPGRQAPLLVKADTVAKMRTGSVVVDLAGSAGGNCELSDFGKTVEHNGVKIIAPLNLPAELAQHSSMLYARNIHSLLELIIVEGQLKLDFDDEIIATACVSHQGEVRA